MSVRLTAGDGTSQTFDTQLMVQRGVLDGPLFDQSGAMSSILSLGGLGFTLPSSLPSFLAGSSIGFDLPSKYIPQIGINLDGSAYFAMGISMKDVTGADDAALWKHRTSRPGKTPARSGKRGLLRQAVCQGAGRMEGAGKQTVSVPG